MWSGYEITIPTKGHTAKESIDLIMKHWVLRFGCPLQLWADQAPEFEAHFFQSVLTALRCKSVRALPYSCRATSKAERTNKRLNQVLRAALTGEKLDDWPLYLGYVCFALNSINNRHTGFTI